MKVFCCKTKIISGAGAVNDLAELGADKVFLVADPYFVKNGTADRVLKAAKARQSEVFCDVQPDPSVELAAAGTVKLKAFKPDLVIALGGGSAIDCAKAIRYFAGEENVFAVIPTTSGSGSEVTDFAILTHGEAKHPLVDPSLRPDVAILDSELLRELPKSLIADSGFDVLSHAVEARVGKNANPFTDALSLEAFRTVMELLVPSFQGDTTVRLKVHAASTMAGLAFTQAGLGLCHAMSHALGGQFHIPHGRLNAILLPAVVAVNTEAMGAKYADLARKIGLGGANDAMGVRNLKNALTRLRAALKLPGSLVQAGIDAGEIRTKTDAIVKAVLADPCCATNPMTVTEEMVRSALREVTSRG